MELNDPYYSPQRETQKRDRQNSHKYQNSSICQFKVCKISSYN